MVWNELEAWQDIEMDTPPPRAFANEERGLKGEARVERFESHPLEGIT